MQLFSIFVDSISNRDITYVYPPCNMDTVIITSKTQHLCLTSDSRQDQAGAAAAAAAAYQKCKNPVDMQDLKDSGKDNGERCGRDR